MSTVLNPVSKNAIVPSRNHSIRKWWRSHGKKAQKPANSVKVPKALFPLVWELLVRKQHRSLSYVITNRHRCMLRDQFLVPYTDLSQSHGEGIFSMVFLLFITSAFRMIEVPSCIFIDSLLSPFLPLLLPLQRRFLLLRRSTICSRTHPH